MALLRRPRDGKRNVFPVVRGEHVRHDACECPGSRRSLADRQGLPLLERGVAGLTGAPELCLQSVRGAPHERQGLPLRLLLPGDDLLVRPG